MWKICQGTLLSIWETRLDTLLNLGKICAVYTPKLQEKRRMRYDLTYIINKSRKSPRFVYLHLSVDMVFARVRL